MAPKSFHENLLESLTDQKIIDVLGKTLRAIIHEIIAPIMLEVDKVVKKCGEHEKKVELLQSENQSLRLNHNKQVDKLSMEISSLQSHTRRNNLIVKGLPESSFAEAATDASTDDVTQQVTWSSHSVCLKSTADLISSSLGLQLAPSDISFAFRMKKGKQDVHRPLFISFNNQKLRDQVYQVRTRLKGKNIYINKTNICEHMLIWSNGITDFLKVTEQSVARQSSEVTRPLADFQTISIRAISDLSNFFSTFQKKWTYKN